MPDVYVAKLIRACRIGRRLCEEAGAGSHWRSSVQSLVKIPRRPSSGRGSSRYATSASVRRSIRPAQECGSSSHAHDAGASQGGRLGRSARSDTRRARDILGRREARIPMSGEARCVTPYVAPCSCDVRRAVYLRVAWARFRSTALDHAGIEGRLVCRRVTADTWQLMMRPPVRSHARRSASAINGEPVRVRRSWRESGRESQALSRGGTTMRDEDSCVFCALVCGA